MMLRTVAIKLKIPDNEAYTALTTLRRLGIEIGRVERADVWQFDDTGETSDFAQRVERNETLFNPNKHELEVLESDLPREGEAWIEQTRYAKYVAAYRGRFQCAPVRGVAAVCARARGGGFARRQGSCRAITL